MFFIEKGNLPKIKIIIFMAETTCTIYQRMVNIKRKIKTTKRAIPVRILLK